MQAVPALSFVPDPTPQTWSLPFTLQGEMAMAMFRMPEEQASALMPTPKLTPWPFPGRCSLVVVLGIDCHESMLGPFRAVLVGLPVIYSALREHFWAQRQSSGLWLHWGGTDRMSVADLMAQSFGLNVKVGPIHLHFSDQAAHLPRSNTTGALMLSAKRPILPSWIWHKEQFIYTRRGNRLLNSRLTLQAKTGLAFGLRPQLQLNTSFWRAADLPYLADRCKLAVTAQSMIIQLSGSGREYDI